MIKQVILMRKDLKMRRGKEIAQGAHASAAFLTKRLKLAPAGVLDSGLQVHEVLLSPKEVEWLRGDFTKVCLQVDSEQELLDLMRYAHELGLEVDLVTDLGKTEFAGVSTITCCAIGPDDETIIDKVIGHLKLY